MRLYVQCLAGLGMALYFAACGHLTLQSTADLNKLPVSRGVNTGSVHAQNPWQYLGSDPDVHEFHYYFHRDGTLRRRKVTIPHDAAILEFPEAPLGASAQWVLLDSTHTQFHFRLAPPQNPQPIRLKDLFPAGQSPPL